MDLLKQLNDGVKYIEQHLQEEVDLDRAAQIACMPRDSFLRFFSYMTGMTVAQYLRRRKLTLAAADLQQNSARVLDIALKYGYDSADAFTRAFTRQHGVTPSAVRQNGAVLKLYPPISFAMTVSGGRETRLHTTRLESVPLRDFLEQQSLSGEKPVKTLWENRFGRIHGENIRKTCNYSIRKENTDTTWYGYWRDGAYTLVSADHNTLPYPDKSAEMPFFPGGQYAVLGTESPNGNAQLRETALKNWLPASDHVLREGATLEICWHWTNWEQTKEIHYSEVWLPIKERAQRRESKKAPLISVLIPVYQTEEYLARCIESVLAQTYPNLEIVLVDDGSTDGSGNVAAGYTDRLNVRYYREEHRGVSHARQKLLERARGEYLFFLDSDDYLDPKTLEILYDLLEKHHADLAQCKMQNVWQTLHQTVDYSAGKTEVYRNENNDLLTRICCNSGMLRCMLTGKLYRRETLNGIQFPVGKIHETDFTHHHIIANCKTVVCTSLCLYNYFYNPNSLTKKGFTYERYDALDAAADRYYFVKDRGLDFAADMVCLWYAWLCVRMYCFTYYEIGENDKNLGWLKESFHRACKYLLTTEYFDRNMRKALIVWMDNPLQGDFPWYWDMARNLYFKHFGHE